MLDQNQINKVKIAAEEFFEKMTINIPSIEVSCSPSDRDDIHKNVSEPDDSSAAEDRCVVNMEIKTEDDPQILIGQQGQTLFEIQRLLRTVLNRKMKLFFYLNLDINDYKNKKMEYLKDLAKSAADQAVLTKEEKILAPMSSYERRVVHAELSIRTDVSTESQGDGIDRHIVIKPK